MSSYEDVISIYSKLKLEDNGALILNSLLSCIESKNFLFGSLFFSAMTKQMRLFSVFIGSLFYLASLLCCL